MNQAAADLHRILRHIATDHHGSNGDFTIDSLFYFKTADGYQGYVPYYFFDKHGVEECYGTSSLHRLAAMHCPGHVVEDFLQHACHHRQLLDITGSNHYQQSRPPHTILCVDPPRIGGQTAKAGATALHVAVCRNSWYVEETTRILLRAYDDEQHLLVRRGVLQPHEVRSLASIPMASGSLPLHVVCGMHTTVRRDLLTALLDADPTAAIRDDSNGDNAFSLLWKNVLQFNWARRMERGDRPIAFLDNCAESLPTWQTIIGRDEYWKQSIIMLRSVLQETTTKRQSKGENTAERCSSTGSLDVDMMEEDQIKLHHIAAIPRCPSLLIRMALASCKFRSQLSEADEEDGMLPLHHAARADPYTTNYLPFPQSVPISCDSLADKANAENIPSTDCFGGYKGESSSSLCLNLESTLNIVCAIYPNAAAIMDRSGRLPLHLALRSGKTWNAEIQTLFDAHPEGLSRADPRTGLLPFMTAAVAEKDLDNESMITNEGKNKEQDMFTTSFLLLRKKPEVIMHCVK